MAPRGSKEIFFSKHKIFRGVAKHQKTGDLSRSPARTILGMRDTGRYHSCRSWLVLTSGKWQIGVFDRLMLDFDGY
jgi:hypothetical protein